MSPASSFRVAAMRSSIVSVFVDVPNTLCWGFPYSTLCKVGFMAMYWLNLSWNVLFCPSMMIESFAGNSSLGRHPWSQSLNQDLLAFDVGFPSVCCL